MLVIKNILFCILIKSKLIKTNYGLISSNCISKKIYKYFSSQHLNTTPTLGLFFEENDFIKFCDNIDHYLSLEMQNNGTKKHSGKDYPVATLGDIIIHLLHYPSFEDAKTKWTRRTKRFMSITKQNRKFLIYTEDKNTYHDFMRVNPTQKIVFSASFGTKYSKPMKQYKDTGLPNLLGGKFWATLKYIDYYKFTK